jgi:hypothetical protein
MLFPTQPVQWQPTPAQFTMGQPMTGQPFQWIPYPIYVGSSPNSSLPGYVGHQSHVQTDGGPPATEGANPTDGVERIHGSSEPGTGMNPYPGFLNADFSFGSNESGQGTNPYPNHTPGFLPFLAAAFTGRPEPGDPLFVSTADGPELRLISQQLTGPETYPKWSQEFRHALATKDKDGFLDGTIPIPTDEHLARLWRKSNRLVRTWIGNCLSTEVSAGLPPTEDAKGMWDNIKEMYGTLDQAKIFTLMQELSDLKQGNSTVTACFNKLSSLWNSLEAAEEKLEGPESTLRQYKSIKDREKATRFLLILNDNFLTFRSQILAMDPMPSIGRIYQLAVQEESQRFASPENAKSGESIALAVHKERKDGTQKTLAEKRRGVLGFRGEGLRAYKSEGMNGSDRARTSDGSQETDLLKGSDGQDELATKGTDGQIFATSSRNFGQNFKGKGRLFCDYCKRSNHSIDSCWKLHGKPAEKGKRISAAFQLSGSPGPNSDHTITYGQYHQLMQALQKLDVSDKRGSFFRYHAWLD